MYWALREHGDWFLLIKTSEKNKFYEIYRKYIHQFSQVICNLFANFCFYDLVYMLL